MFENSLESNIPAFPVPVVGTTATGDSFVSALVAALCEGRLLVSAAEFACAAAAISVTLEGARPSLLHCEEVIQFMDERNKSK